LLLLLLLLLLPRETESPFDRSKRCMETCRLDGTAHGARRSLFALGLARVLLAGSRKTGKVAAAFVPKIQTDRCFRPAVAWPGPR
jgi:hypothetical protein